MKLIIDIPESMYNFVNTKRPNGYFNEFDKFDTYDISKSIRNGKPLPKEHGDIIDRDELLNTLEKLEWIRTNCSVDEDNTNILEDIIGEVPAIIEADRGE